MKILIVEDDTTTRILLQESLSKVFKQVDCVECGEDAVLQHDAYDAMIMDVNLPGISGIDTARIIKQIKPGRVPCIIILTSDYSADVDDVVYSAGADHYVSKENNNMLSGLIFRLLNARRMIRKERGDCDLDDS